MCICAAWKCIKENQMCCYFQNSFAMCKVPREDRAWRRADEALGFRPTLPLKHKAPRILGRPPSCS